MLDSIRKFVDDESGATAVEYGLIAMLICVALIGGARSVGLSVNTLWGNNATTVGQTLGN